jgi:hypothetical protein
MAIPSLYLLQPINDSSMKKGLLIKKNKSNNITIKRRSQIKEINI